MLYFYRFFSNWNLNQDELKKFPHRGCFPNLLELSKFFCKYGRTKIFNHLLILFALSSSVLLVLTLLAENCNDLDKDYIALTLLIYLIVTRVKTDWLKSCVTHWTPTANSTYRYMTNSPLQMKHIPEALFIWPANNARFSEFLSLSSGANPTCPLSIIFHR